MKTHAKTSFLLIILFTAFSISTWSQKGVEDGSRFGHGKDSIRCLRNYSLYREYYKQKDYQDAFPFWRIVFNECPIASKSIYQNGATMYKHKIYESLKNKDNNLANTYLDTLMMIYDQRVKWYPGDKARVLGYKGIDLTKFKKKDPEALKQAYTYLGQSIDIYQLKTPKPNMAAYMDITISLFKDNIITNEEVVNNYAKLMNIIDKQLDENPGDADLKKLKDSMAALFTSSGAATCESLIALFTPNFEKNKYNADELKKYVFWLKSTDCTDADLYFKALVALNKIEPKAENAFTISRLLKKRGQYDQAIDYLKQAVKLETNGSIKSKYYVEIADITFRITKNLPAAKDYCEKAIQADPKSGLPHMLLGSIYANAKNYGDDELAYQSVFCAAVDQFVIAKKKDPSLTDMANERIATFSKHFPSKETVFFFTYKAGDTYEIKGWINEETRVRIRQE